MPRCCLSFATVPGIFLLRWLMFRFMFMSGVVKLLSGDLSWWNLSALDYHFLTQPLPTPLAWYAAQMPAGLLAFATGAMFFIELVLPFFVFAPRRLRFVAAFAFLLLQFCILITGNYNWFNLQTMLLCLPLFDDAALRKILPARLAGLKPKSADAATAGEDASSAHWAADRGLQPGAHGSALRRQHRTCMGAERERLDQSAECRQRLRPVRHHDHDRREIVMEGSYDGAEWHEYEFRYKPGNVMRAPPWNIPHQPRLDWQMWFAALDDPQRLPWFWRFVERLLENEPTVTALLEKNPFADKPPHICARAVLRLHLCRQRKQKGQWWNRRLLGE